MIFTAVNEDVTVMIRKTGTSLPTITSVIITDGTLPGEPIKQEYCEADCGIQGESVPVILGGTDAREGAWPWNVGKFPIIQLSSISITHNINSVSHLLQARYIDLEFSLWRNNHQQKNTDNNRDMFVHNEPSY